MKITKYKDGSYQLDISLGFNSITGKRQRKRKSGFKTIKEAEIAGLELRNQQERNILVQNSKVDFKSLRVQYFESIRHTKKQIYLINQKYSFDKHVFPYFKDANIKKLKTKDIVEFQAYLIDKRLSNNTINKLIINLNQVFKLAVKNRLIATNPVEDVPMLRVEKQKMKFWTINEFQQFYELIQDDELVLKVFFQTAYYTGARVGELCALQWQDIDFSKKTISITKTMHKKKGGTFLDTPKTRSSIRKIAIHHELILTLKEWRKEQKRTIAVNNDTFVFQYKDIPPVRDNFSKRIKPICQRGEIEPIRMHDFRHSHVALLIELGEDMLIVKERLGHSSITTTIDVYGHLFPTRQEQLASKLDSVLKKSGQ